MSAQATSGDSAGTTAAGGDILTDTVASSAGDGNVITPQSDAAIDSSDAGGRLALTDVLPDAGSLATFLSFSYDSGTDSTIIDVKSDGVTTDEQVVLAGVGDLTNSGASDAAAIIEALLAYGKLITD